MEAEMDSIRQYLDLYEAHRELIDKNSAPVLNRLRPEAARRLKTMQMPLRGDEDYAAFDMNAAFAPDFGINLQRVPMDVDTESTFHCDVPVASQTVLLNLNDTFAVRQGALDTLPDGVEAGSLREYAQLSPEEVERHYGKIADMSNPAVDLNTLFAQDGLYIRVRRGVHVERPIQLVNILAAGVPFMAVRRVLVEIEEGASATLLTCDHSQRDDINLMALQTIEVHVGRNARFDYYDLEESTPSTTRVSTFWLEQEEGSEVTVAGFTLFNGNTRNEYRCRFLGPDASLRLYGMGIADGTRVISTYTHVDHSVPQCKTDELFKFTVDGQSMSDFTGRIHVAPGASGTEAYQSNRNLVGEGGAKMDSRPQLEIYNDDVKCSHGSATGQLDPMEIFYMRSRGLTEETARRLLRQAFMADVIAAVKIAPLRDRLHILTERRFAGAQSACSKCHGNGC